MPEQVDSAAFCDMSEARDAFEMRKDANSCAHMVRAVRGPCEPGFSETLVMSVLPSTFLKAARRSVWWRDSGCTSRERRTAMRAESRS